MPMGFSDEDVRRAMLDMFGDDGSSLEWGDGGPTPKGNMPAPPGPGGGGILDSDPGQLQAPAVDWSNLDLGLSGSDLASLGIVARGAGIPGQGSLLPYSNQGPDSPPVIDDLVYRGSGQFRPQLLGGPANGAFLQPVNYHVGGAGSGGFGTASNIAPMGPSGPQGAAQILPLQVPHAALLGNSTNPNASAVAQTNEGILGKISDFYHEALNKVTSPEVTDVLKRQGGYVNKAGDYVGLGGRGLAVAGIVTGQPELTAPGMAGVGLGEFLNLAGNGAI